VRTIGAQTRHCAEKLSADIVSADIALSVACGETPGGTYGRQNNVSNQQYSDRAKRWVHDFERSKNFWLVAKAGKCVQQHFAGMLAGWELG
jgi:hypothetical protein